MKTGRAWHLLAMASDLAKKYGLGERETTFVRELAEHGDKKAAAVAAGYSSKDANRAGNDLLRTPEVARALHVEIISRLAGDAATARNVARKIMEDEAVSPKTRADIAFRFLDRAGFGVPKAAESPRDVKKIALHEMTTDELRSVAEHLEAEIAGRAKRVNAPDAPDTQDQVVGLLA